MARLRYLVILTRRQREVLALTARGLTIDQIADWLGISSRMVRLHTSNAYKRLSTTQSVIWRF